MSDNEEPSVPVSESESSVIVISSDNEDSKQSSSSSSSTSSSSSSSESQDNDSDVQEIETKPDKKPDQVIELNSGSDDEISNDTDYSFEFNDENCDKRIDEFVEITKSNSALAMFFLQDRKWNVQRSVNDYFAETKKKEQKGLKRVVFCRADSSASEADDEGEEAPTKSNDTRLKTKKTFTGGASTSSGITSASTSKDSGDKSDSIQAPTKDNFFRLVTYNIDGMQPKNLPIRIKAICDIIIKEKAAIVFLQEVTIPCEEIIEERLGEKFDIFTGFNSTTDYFTLTLVVKGGFFKVLENDVIEYKNTFMGRNLLKVNVTDGKRRYCFLNSHLESTKEGAEFRVEQLKFIFNYFKTMPRDVTVIAGGDFNLRDTEVTAVGGLPRDVVDAWIQGGQRKECEFTWDTLRNDSLCMPTKWKPRCRFDRVYIRTACPPAIDLVHFGLIGIERLKPNICFPSDHWGVITSYKFR